MRARLHLVYPVYVLIYNHLRQSGAQRSQILFNMPSLSPSPPPSLSLSLFLCSVALLSTVYTL